MKQNRKNENGNALWLILLAVVLLSVLTITISRSTDTAEQTGNIERFRVQASDIMRHSSGIQQAVSNMRMRGIGENQMSFENDFTAVDYSNASCLSGDCLVFGSAGGGASYRTPQPDWLDSTHAGDTNYGEWEFAGTNNITGISSANPELIMYVAYLKPSLCAQINAMLDIAGAVPVDADGIDSTAFQGAFAANDTIDNMDDNETGCFRDTSLNGRDYTFYHVLVKR